MASPVLARTRLLARLVDACAGPHADDAVAAVRDVLAEAGVVDADVAVADGTPRVLVPGDADLAEALDALLALAAERDQLRERLEALAERFDTNQRLSGVGSYDWHIATDTNRWTDRLFRIYGEEPGSFEPSYREFIARVHPDDRERVEGIHRRAFEERSGYQMHERIIRPDGQVRTLWSTGEVICDQDGTPVRMAGVCEDVTDKLAEEERIAAERERLAADRVRHDTARELNDNVVQGLTAVLWAIEGGQPDRAVTAARRTLEAARAMLDRMMPDGPAPGDLVRRAAAPSMLTTDPEEPSS